MIGRKNIILAYHSLSPPKEGCEDISTYVSSRQRVSASLFEKQLRWLSRFAEFVSLNEIIKSERADQWRVAVTFDDGYRDNVELGLPLFQRYEVPVTWFISTEFIENPELLPWWDLVCYIMEQTRDGVSVTIAGEEHTYRLDSSAKRDKFRRDVREIFTTRDRSTCKALYNNLRTSASQLTTSSLPSNDFADRELIMQAVESSWITIGAHSVSHLNLAKIASREVWKEVAESRSRLQAWTDEPVDWFAYPYGGQNAYNDRIQNAVQEAGFKGAVTTNLDYVTDVSDLFALPRLMVPPWLGMIGFKASILALNRVNWITQKHGDKVRWLYQLLERPLSSKTPTS